MCLNSLRLNAETDARSLAIAILLVIKLQSAWEVSLGVGTGD